MSNSEAFDLRGLSPCSCRTCLFRSLLITISENTYILFSQSGEKWLQTLLLMRVFRHSKHAHLLNGVVGSSASNPGKLLGLQTVLASLAGF